MMWMDADQRGFSIRGLFLFENRACEWNPEAIRVKGKAKSVAPKG